jgi:tetratricopeptide (TPR) repeat protein
MMTLQISTDRKAKFTRYVWLLPVLLAAAFFLPTIHYGLYLWDDETYLMGNSLLDIHSLQDLRLVFSSFFNGNYHPFTLLSLAFDKAISGKSYNIYHIHNVFLHAANCTAVFFFTAKLTGKPLTAMLTAALYAILPQHCESVIWISERKNLLYSLYFLLSMIFYLKAVEKNYYRNIAISFIFFLFSCFSKGQAVVLPLCLLALDLFRGQLKTERWRHLYKAPFIIVAILFGVLAIYAQHYEGYTHSTPALSLFSRTATASVNYFQYLISILLPISLSIFYPHFTENHTLLLYGIPAIAGFAVLWTLVLVYRKKISRYLIFGLLFFSINIFPVLQLFAFGEARMADRYTYLPALGILLPLVFITDSWIAHKKTAVAIFFAYLVFFGTFCYLRTLEWASNKQLLTSALERSPENPVLLNNMASLLMKEKKYSQALTYSDQSAEADSTYTDAFYNRAIIKNAMGKEDEALNDYARVLRQNPLYFSALYNRGNIYLRKGDYERAEHDFSAVLSIVPNHYDALNNRGLARGNKGRICEATGDFSAAIFYDSSNYKAWFNRGYFYAKMNLNTAAIKDFSECIRCNPRHYEAYFYRGILRLECGENGCQDLKKAAESGDPSMTQAYSHYCR